MSLEQPPKKMRKLKTPAFHRFFDDCAEVFLNHVRPFLTLDDLLVCAKAGRSLHRLCRTYTLGDVFAEKAPRMGKDHRLKFGKIVGKNVTSHGGITEHRPCRIVIYSRYECRRSKLYHPQELPQVHCLLDEYLQQHGLTKQEAGTPRQPFFAARLPERDLLIELIIKFMTVQDLLSFMEADQSLRHLCEVHTIPELLPDNALNRKDCSSIVETVEKQTAKFNYTDLKCAVRPSMLLSDGTGNWLEAQLYHPEEVSGIRQVIDDHLPKVKESSEQNPQSTSEWRGFDLEAWKLRAQTFSAPAPTVKSATFGGADVTQHVLKLIRTHGRLLLQAPPPVDGGPQPSTFQWWYTRIFGDPDFGKSKTLLITVRDPLRGDMTADIDCWENRELDILLRAPQDNEVNREDYTSEHHHCSFVPSERDLREIFDDLW